MIGTTVSHYRILSVLGDGGMGVVYEAEDPRLGRNVALKFLPEGDHVGPQALERFKLEARAASALNHPHICTVYDIGEHAERPFIVMERMKGHTLRHCIDHRRVPIDQVVDLAIQIADALDTAHGAGIVHRDLKPANIFVTDRGQAKLLDFGLAKLTAREREKVASEADTAARELNLTRPGLTIGTVAYMSPEQAHGDEVDARSDLFSIGVVLYELATGRLPFPGKTSAEIFNGILSHFPPLPSSLEPRIPPMLEEILLKALEKDRETRYQTAADLRADLKRLKRGSDSGTVVPPSLPSLPRTRIAAKPPRWPLYAAGLAVALSWAVTGLVLRRGGKAEPFLVKARFQPLTDLPGLETAPSLSPDGQSVVYASRFSGNWDVYLQRVGGRKAINLTADSPADDSEPQFSPDGAFVAFRSEREGGGLFVMGATGESVRRVSTFGFNPAWSRDGRRLAFATERLDDPKHRWSTSTLWVVEVATGATRQLTTTDAVQPSWSPGGIRIAYWAMSPAGQRDLWTVPAAGGTPTQVTDDAALDWDPVWARDGRHLFFGSDRAGSMNLWRIPVDEETGAPRAEPEPITTPSADAGFLSLSADEKTLAYVAQAVSRNIVRMPFDARRHELSGPPVPVTRGSSSVRDLDVSPDGSYLAYNSESTEKLFVVRTDGSGTRQLTDGGSFKDRGPRFSPDGSRIAFYSNRTGAYQIWMVKPDGSELRQVTEDVSTGGLVFPVWSRDGRTITASSFEATAFEVDVGRSWAEQTPETLPPVPTPGHSFMAYAWSPSGRKLAGWELGAEGVSLGLLIYDPATRGYRRVTEAGTFPAWSTDETRLVFSQRHKRLAVDLDTGQVKELSAGGDFEEEFMLSHDRRWLYTVFTQREGDVWIAARAGSDARP